MKKLVSALLALTLVGSLAACGSQNTPSASASGSAGGEDGYKIVLISNQKSGDMGPVDAMFAGAKRAEAISALPSRPWKSPMPPPTKRRSAPWPRRAMT